MAEKAGSLVFDTRIDSDGFSSGLGKLGSVVKRGLQVVGTAFAGASAYAFKVGMDFESAMSEVSAISGATGEDFEALKEKAKQMGSTTKFSATESAEAMKYMAMAGWDTSQMLSGLEGIMNLAAASGEDLATTSDIVTDALTAFGLKAEDATHFSDVLASASSNANTNVSMMGETFKYVAPVAGALGFSAEDCALAIGLMANAGIKGSQAGTALRSILTRMSKPTNEVAQVMDELGISLTDAEGNMKSFEQIMQDLRQGFSGLTNEQKAQYAATLAGQEGMSALLAIVNASEDDYNKLSDAINNCDGAAKRMADTMNDNLQGKLTIMRSALEGLGISAYEKFSNPMKEAIENVTSNIERLTRSMNSGKLSGAMDSTARGLANIAEVGINAVVGMMPKMIEAFGWITDHGATAAGALIGLAAAYTYLTNAQAINNAVSAGMAVASLALGVATDLLTGKITLAAAAQEALNLAQMLSPAGLLAAAVIGLTAAVAGYMIVTISSAEAQDENTVSTEKLINEYEQLTETLEANKKAREEELKAVTVSNGSVDIMMEKLEALAKVENKSSSEKEMMKYYVDQLNAAMPELNLQYDAEADALNKTTEEIRQQIEAQKELNLAKAYQKQLTKIAEDMVNVQEKYDKAVKQNAKNEADLSNAIEETNKARADAEKHNADLTDGTNKYTKKLAEATLKETQARENYNKSSKAVDDLEKELKDLDSQYDSMEGKAAEAFDTATVQEALERLKALCQEAGVGLPEWLSKGIEEGKYAVPQSLEEMNNLISFKDLLDKADKAGIEVPKSLQKQIMAGSPDAKKAVEDLTKACDEELSKMPPKAKETATNATADVAKGFRENKADVRNAAGEVKQSGISGISGGEFGRIGSDQGSGYSKSLGSKKSDAKTSGSSLKQAGVDGSKGGYNEMYSNGSYAADGYNSGIRSKIGAIAQSAADLVKTAVDAARRAQESHSPSRLWKREIGMMAGEGLALGYIAKQKRVNQAARDLVKGAWEEAEKAQPVKGIADLLPTGQLKKSMARMKEASNQVMMDFVKSANTPTGPGQNPGGITYITNYNNDLTFNGDAAKTPSQVATEVENMTRRQEWGNRR